MAGESRIEEQRGQDRLLTVREVAVVLGLAVGTIYHMVSQGRLPFVRLSARCLRFRASAIQRFIESLAE
jgi:excisionase family DNA binding protein